MFNINFLTLLKQLSKCIYYDVYHFLLPIHFTLTQNMILYLKRINNKLYKQNL